MTHMPNAPLIYTLGVVRFTRVPEFEKFAEQFFTNIRAPHYPYDEKFDQVSTIAQFGIGGINLKEDRKVIWQYLSPNKDCGFLIGDDMICFHTSKYIDFKEIGRAHV